ncbi:hypothetical protein EYF80_033797 [Liparis tanakae]|uniref:Uncharacterized protein n=1 Tax=Liparis tanakae TaxID=230148 RepID=A0A4Z2GTA8_9TELE|nr:hypothetical protein EYF80_033797 [Liparis tanakae]
MKSVMGADGRAGDRRGTRWLQGFNELWETQYNSAVDKDAVGMPHVDHVMRVDRSKDALI